MTEGLSCARFVGVEVQLELGLELRGGGTPMGLTLGGDCVAHHGLAVSPARTDHAGLP